MRPASSPPLAASVVAVLLACSSGGSGTPSQTCPSATTLCGAACVDLRLDRANCGACGSPCRADQVCAAGGCACPAGQADCGGACADLQADALHCGACSTACPPTATCAAGACACPAPGAVCGGACVDLATDAASCGTCGAPCTGGATCGAGVCRAPACTGTLVVESLPWLGFTDGAGNTVALGDLDRDGTLDVVGIGQTLVVALGTGGGHFAPVAYPVAQGADAVAIGDLDRDGWPDVLVATRSSDPSGNHVFVYLNDGHGGLGTAAAYVADTADGLALADVDGDGALDVVISSDLAPYGYQGAVEWLRNRGDGTLESGGGMVAGIRTSSVAAADLDGDGRTDLVAGNALAAGNTGGTLSVFRNLGGGTFADAVEVATPGPAQFVLATDVDGDGHPDLVVGMDQRGGPGPALAVLLDDGNGSFLAPVGYGSYAALGVAVGDLDGDGRADLVTAGGAVFRNVGNGAFEPAGSMPGGYSGVALGDVTGDGALDAVFDDGAIFPGDGHGGFPSPARFEQLDRVEAIADLDGDGRLDLVGAGWAATGHPVLRVWLASGVRAFRALDDGPALPESFFKTWLPSAALADLDGDGRLDLARVDPSETTVQVLRGTGPGTFAAPTRYDLAAHPGSIRAADLDGDGALDLVVAPASADGVEILYGRGDGSFELPVHVRTHPTGDLVTSVAVGDVDGDARPELVVADSQYGVVRTVRVGADRSTTLGDEVFVGVGPTQVEVADLDADGLADAVVLRAGSYTDDGVEVLRATGGGLFEIVQHLAQGGQPQALVLADVDGDGRHDVLTSDLGQLAVFRGAGDGTFGAETEFPALVPVAVADLDRDGRADLVVTRSWVPEVSWGRCWP